MKFFISLFLMLIAFLSSAQAAKYAALVMDAETGKILHADNANAQVHPASLTKMMTLYILFEELEAKRLTLNSAIRVSKNAARQIPTKLGVPAGKTVRVKEVLLALVTRSANDMAMALAEKKSGTEAAFVRLMNQKAKSLGLHHTCFKNVSGLPHKHQVTTAMDMARLSQALLKRFPTYYRYFNTKAFTYEGRKIHNHNKLLGRVEGLDGIKTGFICASGFNIATSAVRDGHRLIGIVIGGKTARERDRRMINLLEASFSQLPEKSSPSSSESLLLAERASEFPKAEPSGHWYVQVGTYKKAQDAHMAAALLLAKLPVEYNPFISVLKSDLKRAKLYRARLGGFDKASAKKVCGILKKQGMSCLVTRDPVRTKMLAASIETG